MLAVADYVDGNGRAPRELGWGLNAERYNVLPYPGALREQPAGTVRRMNAAVAVYRHAQAYKSASSRVDWVNNNPDAWELLSYVKKLQRERVNNGD